MNPEDYVSYPIALALKKAGFDWECDHVYIRDRQDKDKYKFADWTVDSRNWNKRTRPQTAISTPALSQAQKWLREEKRMVIIVTPETDMADFNDIPKEFLTGEWCYEIWVDNDTHRYGMESHTSYESALSAGIAAALGLIKKKGE